MEPPGEDKLPAVMMIAESNDFKWMGHAVRQISDIMEAGRASFALPTAPFWTMEG